MFTTTVHGTPCDPHVTARDRALEDAHRAVDLLGRCDLRRCGPAELDRLDGAAQRLRGFLIASDVHRARRRDEVWGADGGLDEDPSDPAANGPDTASGTDVGTSTSTSGCGGSSEVDDSFEPLHGRRPGPETERDRSRAAAGDRMPAFETALLAGEIDVAHLDAIVAALIRFETGHADDVAARDDFLARESELLEHARTERPDRFRRRCLDVSRHIARDHGLRIAERQRRDARLQSWIDRRTGMGHIHLVLEPELYDTTITALDAQLSRLRASDPNSGTPWERLRVDAFTQLITHSGAHHRRSAEVVVLIDWQTLRDETVGPGGVSETIDGTPLHPTTVRRLACEAGILPVTLGGDGVPLDVGRTERLATPGQRRALAAMYATCAHPDCQRPFRRCRIHHLDPWEHHGETNLDLLIPLCERHHHDVHEGGWTLTMTPDRVTTWLAPDGTHWFTGDTRDRPPP